MHTLYVFTNYLMQFFQCLSKPVGPFILTASVKENRRNKIDCFLKVRSGMHELEGSSCRKEASIFFFKPDEDADSVNIIYYGQQLKDVSDHSQIIKEHKVEWLLKACGSVYTFRILPRCRGCPHVTHDDHELCAFKLEQQHEHLQKTHTELLMEVTDGKKAFYISSCEKKRKVYLKMTKNKLGESFSSECSSGDKMLFTCQSVDEEWTCAET